MRGRARVVGCLLVVLGLGIGGCGSSQAPIPDPGGPFHTDVPPNTTLGALTSDQTQELCGEITSANDSFGIQGVGDEQDCRRQALQLAAGLTNDEARDGGSDGGSFLSTCQATLDTCEQQAAAALASKTPTCFFSGCGATVELVSACLNELANTDPIATCVLVPTCAAAAGGAVEPNSPTPCSTGMNAPPLPACDRLNQQCPGATAFNPY